LVPFRVILGAMELRFVPYLESIAGAPDATPSSAGMKTLGNYR
jgi:hypothetical protein